MNEIRSRAKLPEPCHLCYGTWEHKKGCPVRIVSPAPKALARFIAGYRAHAAGERLPYEADQNDKSFALGWRQRNKGLRVPDFEAPTSEGPHRQLAMAVA